MATINKITKLTDKRFVNLYQFDGKNSKGYESHYMVASRSEKTDNLKAVTHTISADGVAIYSLYGENHDKVVLIKQYRYPIDSYIYEFPAGLVEKGEDFNTAAIRELHEETGLTFTPIQVNPMYTVPRYTTVGLTDETCAIAFGYATGEISQNYLEKSEEIEIVLADKEEVKRILKEENVALICAYQLMHFIHDSSPFEFLKNN